MTPRFTARNRANACRGSKSISVSPRLRKKSTSPAKESRRYPSSSASRKDGPPLVKLRPGTTSICGHRDENARIRSTESAALLSTKTRTWSAAAIWTSTRSNWRKRWCASTNTARRTPGVRRPALSGPARAVHGGGARGAGCRRTREQKAAARGRAHREVLATTAAKASSQPTAARRHAPRRVGFARGTDSSCGTR